MNKKIIFIGGSSYSGSTFLDMMLANASSGFSCGESYALFRPHRFHHINPQCICGDLNCDIWKKLKKQGERYFFRNLFQEMPFIDFIVDSSKDPLWIKDQMKNLADSNIDTHNILIWKTPAEFAYSRSKRGLLKKWERSWINYHKSYFSCVDKWYSIRYQDLAQNPSKKLERLCEILGIEFFQGKENYWEKTHHTLFGNTSAKIHLSDKTSDIYLRHEVYLKKRKAKFNSKNLPEINYHKSVYYEDPIKNYFINNKVEKHILNSKIIQRMIKILKLTDINRYQWDESILSKTVALRRPYYIYFSFIHRLRLKWKGFMCNFLKN